MNSRAHGRPSSRRGRDGSAPPRNNLVQRKCACGAPAGMNGKCTECERQPASVPPLATTETVQLDGLQSVGSPTSRTANEAGPLVNQTPVPPRLGHDFSQIQVVAPVQRGAGDGGPTPKDAPPKAQAKPKPPPGTTTIGAPARQTYPVTGATLAQAAAVIEAREEAGLTEWKPKLKYDKDDAGLVTHATVTVPLTITMPNWSAASKLSKAAKAEWDRFYQALEAHEQGHVDLVNKHLGGLGATLVGKTEAEASDAFANAVQELKDASDTYDVDTDHGRNHGTELDVGIK